MNYLLINASPRGKESNSGLIAGLLKEGIQHSAGADEKIEIISLRRVLRGSSWQEAVEQADVIVIVFPLYADLVPGILKQFIEELGRGSLKEKKLGWLAQCGFPDSVHLELVERYLEKTSVRLGALPAGIIRKAGVEGIRMMPPSMTAKLFESFRNLGESLASDGIFNKEIIEKLSRPRLYGPGMRLIIRIMSAFGFTNFYWNKKLKENGAYKQRFAKPYAP